MKKLTPLLPRHRKAAGFAPSGLIEMLLLAYIVAAVLNLALGNWIFATAMMAPLAGLFFWIQYTDRRGRCRIGDQVRLSMGSHAGKEGVIIGANETGTRFTVQMSSSDHPDPLDFSGYQLTKMKPVALPSS
ncbi:MAG: hypothetical protein WAW39_24505 [Prosthecobacter sp.]|uniref:hypothetical protein n=1 Tax=Prosthecobacter sp. TaxID=1965333 RepID=UPI003BAF5A50